MTLRDLVLKMHADEKLVLDIRTEFPILTTPNEISNEYEILLQKRVEHIRWSPMYYAIYIEFAL